MTKKTIPFQASARLQRLIGRGLIPNEEMAIVELVKNAYDSGAHTVQIYIQPDRLKEPGFIRISDDGSGMSEADIERLFMFAGYSERPDQLDKGRRVPTGEKGIGRFATDKLGRTLDVFTAKVPKDGIHLSIDWRKFEAKASNKFSDITATYEPKDLTVLLHGKRGTVLEIRRLTSRWEANQVDRLVAWLSDLLDPFSKPRDFTIELQVGGSAKGTFRVDPTPPTGNISMEIAVVGDKVRRVVHERGKKVAVVDETVPSVASLDALRGLRARFVHFDKRPTKSDTNGLAAGVRVYRDGFRIEPFGSRTSDWLGIAEKRAKRAGHAHVVPNRLFGFVEISRRRNPELSDTTSRQALVDTDAATNMVTMLREGLDALGEILRTRTEPRWQENRRRKQAELEQARLHTLGEVASGLAHELRQPLQIIRSEADNIREKLNALGIKDDDIAECQAAIDRGVVRIDKSISLVSNLSRGNLTDVSDCDLVVILRNESDYFSNLCTPLGISMQLNVPQSQFAKVNEAAVSSVIANFIRNAMQSIESSGGTSITISLRKVRGFHRIEIEDDGPGVPEEVMPQLFSRFATKKTGGMGVGLHYCKILVESHRGQIGYTPKRRGALFWVQLPE